MENKGAREIAVFITRRLGQCASCGKETFPGYMITVVDGGILCPSCSDLDHLVFLPSGDAALTLRSKKHSKLWAVVLKWSRARKQYERQGLLVEEEALQRAEEECLLDAEVRERRKQRDRERRELEDKEFKHKFAEEILRMYPSAPSNMADRVASHACQKHSGRVGRTAAAKELEEEAIRLAVRAHIRHQCTQYDVLLMRGTPREDARRAVAHKVSAVEGEWLGSTKE